MNETSISEEIGTSEDIEPFTVSIPYFIGIYFLTTWLGLFPSVIFGYWYFTSFPFDFNFLYIILLLPLFFILYGIALFSSLITTKFAIWIVHKRVAYPEEGNYPFSLKHPQVRAWVLKGNLKNFARWLFYFFRSNYLHTFWLRRMGLKIGKKVRLGWWVEDEDFIEIGENTFMAWKTILTGHQINQDSLTLCKMRVGKNCIFEFPSGAGGGIIGDNSIFRPVTSGMKGLICRGNAIYQGIPCKKIADNDLTPQQIKELKQNIKKIDKKDFVKEKNKPIKINEVKLFLIKILVVIGGLLFTAIFVLIFYLFFQAFYSPGKHLLNLILLVPVPFLFLIALGAFISGTSIVIKLFLMYYDRKAEIPEGIYELEDPRVKIFKIKYVLRMFGLKLFHGTPFRIADTFAIRLWGNVKIGKNVKLDVATVDPQYLEVGDYSQISAGCRVHTHEFENGKLYIKKVKIGAHVLLGGYCHIKPGVEIADGCFGGIAAWFRKNRKCKNRALWIGKPAFELPIELVRKTANAKDRYVD